MDLPWYAWLFGALFWSLVYFRRRGPAAPPPDSNPDAGEGLSLPHFPGVRSRRGGF